MKHKTYFRFASLILMGIVVLITGSCKKSQDNPDPVDKDGNVYNTVTIGTQVWMKENLKTTHYSNGDAIQLVTDGTAWSNLMSGAYCDYGNVPGNSTTYGRLYNFYTVEDQRGLCPTGWHVPGSVEWEALENYLGGYTIAGGTLKEKGTAHWQDPNTSATDLAGFKALPAGYRNENGSFDGINLYTDIWGISPAKSTDGYRIFIGNNLTSTLSGNNIPKKYGFSVRCIKN